MDYGTTNEVSFFELESTSAMQELAVNDSLNHYRRVYHFRGDFNELDKISKQLLNISLENCTLS